MVDTTRLVPKVNQDLEDGELEVEVPYSEALANLGCKSLHVHLADSAGKELVGHSFDPKALADADSRKALMTIPEQLKGDLQS